MHGHMDNVFTKAEWIARLGEPEDQWSSARDGQQWLEMMLTYHTPEIASDALFDDIDGFLSLLDKLAENYVTDHPHTQSNRRFIHSEWLDGHASESFDMAHDLAYTCARIGGPDLGIAVGAHVLGGWYQLSKRTDDFIRACYVPLLPYVREATTPTVKVRFKDIVVQINLLMSGRTAVLIDKKRRKNDPKAVHLQIVGSSDADGVNNLGLQLVDAPTLGAALGVLDELIAYMSAAPQDPDELRAMLSEGRMWFGGVFSHE